MSRKNVRCCPIQSNKKHGHSQEWPFSFNVPIFCFYAFLFAKTAPQFRGADEANRKNRPAELRGEAEETAPLGEAEVHLTFQNLTFQIFLRDRVKIFEMLALF
jgi:hypothetical protein